MAHEAIPDFVDASGKTVGMDAMTMSIPVDPAVDLAPFSIGDRVDFDLLVDWSTNETRIIALRPLPAETTLQLASPADSHAENDHTGHDHADHADPVE